MTRFQDSAVPTVSVIVPAFNAEAFIATCLRSVQAQTFRGFEVLVVDDGSRDGTHAAACALAGQDPRIRVLQQPNAGVSAARNQGIRASRGAFIAFLDADDTWEPAKLERQLPAFADPRCGLVHTGIRDVDSEGRPCPPSEAWAGHQGDVFSDLLRANFICCSSVMVRADLIRPPHPGFAVGRLCEDWLLWTEIALHHRVGFIEAPLVNYRVHPGGQSRNRAAMLEAELRCREDFLRLARRDGTPGGLAVAREALFTALTAAAKDALRRGDLELAWSRGARAAKTAPWSRRSVDRLVSVYAKLLAGSITARPPR